MAFTVKQGDLVYAADGTLGFVSEVYRPEQTDDADAGWAAIDVTGLEGPVYFTAADVANREEEVPAVLLTLTYAQATDESHRRQPEPVARGTARREELPPLEVGRPEAPGSATTGQSGAEPGRLPQPESLHDWSSAASDQPDHSVPS